MARVLILVLLLASLANPSVAYLNVFISPTEVMKLLGIDAELFYVREGVVNTYALNFVVMVPPNMSDLQFSWQSLTKQPLPYVLSVKYNTEGALLPPQMNISSAGVIPTSVQTFRLRLLCTGLEATQTEVQLHLNVSTHNKLHNNTSVKIRRNKICQKGVKPPLETIRLDPNGISTSTNSLYIAAGCAVTMITLIVIIASAICIKTKKENTRESAYANATYDSNQHVFVRLGSTVGRTSSPGSGSYATIASLHKSPPSPSPYATSDNPRVSYYASSQVMLLSQMALQDPRYCDPTDRIRVLAATRPTVILEELSQEGTFGQIYRGRMRAHETVTVKTVTDAASKLQVSVFLAEGTIMFGMVHKNILPIIGVNTDNARRPLLIYPFSNRGNLKRFLIKCRQREEKPFRLSTRNFVDMAVQIVLGVMYLHSQCICYKDLATRNCVIDEKMRLKITDNSLARDLFPADYACLGDNENRPIKWMAIESLIHKHFTSASDVWSFGVVLWELTTLAHQPFEDIDPFEIASYLGSGYRLQQPVASPDELYAVMTCCWLSNPIERPNFAQLLSYLQEFHMALSKYI
ncbi:PREDICTED: tyrosine-protein kinase Dnt-like [Nicrophorus vespilloides]|uniref:Tyrosine-protein kinase Dnt-like n=1 Tax=Nicrophorus vespilloides TaxID=110193 RepID=A0ABM1M720_NICVS|nr:PREDICTED: tyrosine-protein kinase Dnt-like [Nicrophorus vespilloides]